MQLQQPKLPSAIRVDSEVELRCHVDGSGDMKYEWFKLVASSVLTSSNNLPERLACDNRRPRRRATNAGKASGVDGGGGPERRERITKFLP